MLCLPHSTEPFEVAKTYSQLLQNIEALKRQAEERRRTEVKGVVDRIREAIKFYGLTAADLGLSGGSAGRATTPKAAAGGRAGAAPKFRDGSGNVWSGRGPRPRWLREALAAGRTLEEFQAAGAGPAAKAPAGRRAAKGRRKAAARSVKYRDGAGNTWGGMGKRPQWLRDALTSGRRLEDFLVAPADSAAA